MNSLTLCSLFDGSGGFPLAGQRAGIRPVSAAEIEPFLILVTRKRFPEMKHYGDVSQINGALIEPVDIITFGSPCQDLSIAGKKAGIAGSRSGLFFQAIRIVREMREATNGQYPRYAVWENVPGAFSSNGGADFLAVLRAFCSVKGSEADVPGPSGRWGRAGTILADGYSLAWRVLDAQYWGVPQRRKRVFLVADFDGGGAPEILFDSEGVPGDYQSGKQGESQPSGTVEECSRKTGLLCLNDQGGNILGVSRDVAPTLRAESHGHEPCILSENRSIDSAGQSTEPPVYAFTAGLHIDIDIDRARTLCARDAKGAPGVAYSPAGETGENGQNCAQDVGAGYEVRRLTPTECALLQGFPPDWAHGLETPEPTEEDLQFWRCVFETYRKVVLGSSKPKTDAEIIKWLKNPHSDSAEYRMWGNGVALPCVQYVMNGIARHAHSG